MTADSRHLLSISVVSYHSPLEELSTMLGSLLDALSTLRAGYPDASTSISLIDNSENNQLALSQFAAHEPQLEEVGAELRLIQGQGNVGYGAAHNLAINKADSHYHLVINSDIELDKNGLLKGINYLRDNPDVGAVNPHASFEDGSKQYLCKRYPSVFDFFLRGFMPGFIRGLFRSRLEKFEMRDLSEEQPTKGIPILSGCFMLCRTDALKEAAGFDERYFLYFEDFDLSLRLSKNYELAYLPDMKIVHHGGHSARKGGKHIRLFVQSGKRFFSSHDWRWF